MYADVITHPDSRQFGVGMMNWQSGRLNFTAAPEIVKAVAASKPVEVADELVNQHLGKWVSNPRATGWLVGFDKTAGEAIVTMDDWARPGFNWWNPKNQVVKNLEGLYPVQLRAFKGEMYTAYRNPMGNLFTVEAAPGGFKLAPAEQAFAFRPSEVGVGPYGEPQSLAQALGLDPNAGLRAMGGYVTSMGGRIPLNLVR